MLASFLSSKIPHTNNLPTNSTFVLLQLCQSNSESCHYLSVIEKSIEADEDQIHKRSKSTER